MNAKSYLGNHIEFEIQLSSGTRWTAHALDGAAFAALKVGTDVALEADPSHVIVFADADDQATP